MTATPTTEESLLRRIAHLRAKQEQLETDEAEAMVAGYDSTAINALRRKASQALWNRRKLQKQLDDLRGGVPR